MPHNESDNLERLFASWLSGEPISNEDLQSLKSHPEWAERIRVAENIESHNQQFEASINVPEWDTATTFTRNTRPRSTRGWLSNTLMPTLAMTFSIFACVVMLFDLNLVHREGSWQVLTGEDYRAQWQKQQQAEMSAQLNERLNDWYLQSSNHITMTFDKLEAQQTENTTRLANYLLTSSRTERQQDIQRMVQVLKAQQSEELAYLEDEISRLQYQFRVATEPRPSSTALTPPFAVSEE